MLGVLANLTSLAGILLAVVIWTTAESFGGRLPVTTSQPEA